MASSPPPIRLRRSYASILHDAVTAYVRYHFERARACWSIINDTATPQTVGTAYRSTATAHEQSRQALTDLATRLEAELQATPPTISANEEETQLTIDPDTLADRSLCRTELQTLYIRVHRAVDLPVSEEDAMELDLNVLARAIPHYGSIYQVNWDHLF